MELGYQLCLFRHYYEFIFSVCVKDEMFAFFFLKPFFLYFFCLGFCGSLV